DGGRGGTRGGGGGLADQASGYALRRVLRMGSASREGWRRRALAAADGAGAGPRVLPGHRHACRGSARVRGHGGEPGAPGTLKFPADGPQEPESAVVNRSAPVCRGEIGACSASF